MYSRRAEKLQVGSTAHPLRHRSVEPGGAYSRRKCFSDPKLATRCTGTPDMYHAIRSRSWQHLASSIGEEVSRRLYLPVTNAIAMCQYQTFSCEWMAMTSPMRPSTSSRFTNV